MHEKENAQPLNDVYASMQAHYGLEVRKHGSRFYIAGLNSQTKQEAQQLVDDKGIDVDISLSISRANLAKLYEETTSTTLDDSIRKEFFTTPEKTYKTTSEDHVQELSDALGDTTQIDVGKALEDTSILYNGRNFYQKGRNGSLAKTEALDIISNVIIGYQEESSYQSVDEAVEPTLSVVTAQDTPEVVRPARASATVTPSVVEPSAVGSQIEVVDTEASVTIQHDREYSEPIAPDLQAVSSMAVDKGYVPEAEVFQPVKLDAPARSPWYKALGTAAAVLVATLLPNYTPDADAARHFFKKSKTPTSLSTPSYSKSPKGSAITTSRRGSAISPSGSSRKGRGSAITYTAGPTRGTAISPSGSSGKGRGSAITSTAGPTRGTAISPSGGRGTAITRTSGSGYGTAIRGPKPPRKGVRALATIVGDAEKYRRNIAGQSGIPHIDADAVHRKSEDNTEDYRNRPGASLDHLTEIVKNEEGKKGLKRAGAALGHGIRSLTNITAGTASDIVGGSINKVFNSTGNIESMIRGRHQRAKESWREMKNPIHRNGGQKKWYHKVKDKLVQPIKAAYHETLGRGVDLVSIPGEYTTAKSETAQKVIDYGVRGPLHVGKKTFGAGAAGNNSASEILLPKDFWGGMDRDGDGKVSGKEIVSKIPYFHQIFTEQDRSLLQALIFEPMGIAATAVWLPSAFSSDTVAEKIVNEGVDHGRTGGNKVR